MVRAAEALWGGEFSPPSELTWAARSVISAIVARLGALQDGWSPVPGVAGGLWLEAHQGARRPETLARAACIRELHPVLLRCGRLDPVSEALVWVDRAAECDAQGDVRAQRAALARVAGITAKLDPDAPWYRAGELSLALWCWSGGPRPNWRAGSPARSAR